MSLPHCMQLVPWWSKCGIMMMLEITQQWHRSPLFPPKVSLARQAQASEMGGQHEAGGVDPESTPVPVQRAFHRGLLRYSMGHPLPEEHGHPDHFPFCWGRMYLSCFPTWSKGLLHVRNSSGATCWYNFCKRKSQQMEERTFLLQKIPRRLRFTPSFWCATSLLFIFILFHCLWLIWIILLCREFLISCHITVPL